MPENNEFWDFYWETRLLPMENLGKRAAILLTSKLIRSLSQKTNHPLRLLELGCGEGQVIGTLLDAHAQLCMVRDSVGVDYKAASLDTCHRDYPGMTCVQGDFTDPDLLASLGEFDIVLLVNALHEVFSDSYSTEIGAVDIPVAKQNVKQAFAGAVGCLAPNGWLVLFDGLEPPGNPDQDLMIRFRDYRAKQAFEKFAQQYRPLKITYRPTSDPMIVNLSQRDFTRYITKSIFLEKQLWQSEQLESYQYFTKEEFQAAFAAHGLEIHELRTLTMNVEKWRRVVEIITPGINFPEEHIMILAQNKGALAA